MTTGAPLTIGLEEIDSRHVAVAGGKGASLGELMQVGVRVPPGFVVTRSAFDQFLSEADPQQHIPGLLADVDAGRSSVADASRSIIDLLSHTKLSPEIRAAIRTGTDRLGVPRVSVRSSASCEDGVTSAWAGQLQTFLDITADDIEGRVHACWLSIFRPAALAYGAAHGYGTAQFGVAVVVQEMVSSEVSGIGFSVHPVTQEPGVRLIEACFGLGEAIVSGAIVPDQYVVKRGAEDIVERSTGHQSRGLFRHSGSQQPEWSDLGERGSRPKLNDAQVLEYAGILDQVEDHYGFPVDTEWALADGVFHVLQARPITTLAREYRDPIIDDSQPWVRGMRRPLSLMEASILAHWLDCQHVGDDIGLQIDRFLAIQDSGDLTTMFFPQQEFIAGLNFLCDLDRQDRARLISLLQRANDVYQQGFERISAGEGFDNLDDAVENLIQIGRYTTSLPACTLMALESGHIDDPQVRALAEGLRSHSLYPRFLSRLVEPLVRSIARQLGVEEPDRAPELLTWRELHEGGIDQQVLQQRLRDLHSGYRFVYQFLGGEERVHFVTETGYLLMRESGRRQIVAPDDPNQISGHAAWPGVHRGRARVILKSEPEGYELQDGEVLVSIQSNPNLMPLLRHAGAIVTDDGGVACHAGIICRELKIPTIIGTGRATSAIHDGDLVEVDATEQVVRVLKRAGEASSLSG